VAATLHHQNIVQVHDIGEAAGEYFIAMEYVHGEDVRRILSAAAKQRSYVPLGHAIAIVSAAAAGLHYAHERRGNDKQPLNIVHRDVSPSNIIVGYDGSIKVVDFGIATASLRQETRSGSLKGKLSYMSPEQCKGAVVDRRSDVYALGVVLYELATTTRMIKGENDYLVMEQIVTGRIASPQNRRPGLPSELSDIIMRALTTDRDRRYATADELRLALDQFAAAAGLTASSSAIGAYMRQQFGQRPEPWLELGAQPSGALDDVQTSIEESMPSNSWTELPRLDGDPRRTSSIPVQSGPLAVIPGELAPDATARVGAPQRPSFTPLPSPPPATDSRMGWENQPRTPVPRTFPLQKAAVIGGALAMGVAIWLVVSMMSTTVTPVAAPPAALPAPPLVAPAPTAVSTPPIAPGARTPELGPVAEVVAAGSAAPPTRVAVRDPDPAPRRTRAAPATPTVRTVTRTTIEAPPPSPKPERPTRVAVAAPPEPPARSEPVSDADLHRPAVAPPPPPPPPQNVTQPVIPPTETSPPAQAAAAPQVVAPTALDGYRIAGDKSIVPDETTMGAISRAGADKLVSSYKVCITAEGAISTVTQLKSTGFPAYDTKIATTIRKDWRYRPYVVNGKATPVCTAFRFIYSQK
jgi:serine/threonine protein kinase